MSLHPLAAQLKALITKKKSALCVALDVCSAKTLLSLAETLADQVVMIKTHIDILEDFNWRVIERLQDLATTKGFLIFEDRKFADIGHTVQLQYAKGLYRILEWADLVNAHILPGPGIIEGLAEVGVPKGRGLLLIAEMSSKDHLLTSPYQRMCYELAKKHQEFVLGFVSQHRLTPHEDRFFYLTPGVKLKSDQDALGQQYRTPEMAIIEQGCDIIIVGRDIITAQDPVERAELYRQLAFEAYSRKIPL